MSLSVADRIEINELVAKSHYYADYGHYDQQRECFTEDTVCALEGAGEFPGRDWQVDHAKVSARNTGGKNRHAVTNLWIEPQPDGGAIAHYFMLNVNAGNEPRAAYIAVSGEFQDRVVRVGNAWKVKVRRFITDQPFKLANNGV